MYSQAVQLHTCSEGEVGEWVLRVIAAGTPVEAVGDELGGLGPMARVLPQMIACNSMSWIQYVMVRVRTAAAQRGTESRARTHPPCAQLC